MAFSYHSGNTEIKGRKKLRRSGFVALRGVGAAFGDQKIHQTPHHIVVRMTYQRGCIPYLIDEADDDQRLDVVG
jgi:hypothetical protein